MVASGGKGLLGKVVSMVDTVAALRWWRWGWRSALVVVAGGLVLVVVAGGLVVVMVAVMVAAVWLRGVGWW